ncbi:MAG TPA: chemotaxis response regulator protein-glutamate methylesterase [bacterium]|nr:chemotaxis response regulator protein-glutamate methylesterase [bacterium]HOL47410.1 chemotaxis response regulator protein-glutamate methylesterase [bacterium]HPQ18563.1 chemotaxis response regulator protein-glutamate methylesterase [bacterium]
MEIRSKIRLLIVDDSNFMRQALANMLSSEHDIEIIDFATNGVEGVEKAIKLKPDIITLDVEMPKMNGIEALKQIMKEAPTRVIMVSSLTIEGSKITFEALDNGALDFIAKPGSFVAVNIQNIKNELVKKIHEVMQISITSIIQKQKTKKFFDETFFASLKAKPRVAKTLKYNVIAIGTSTGGPPALNTVLTKLPADFPVGLLIVQHMPVGFTAPLAERLNSVCSIKVKEAATGDIVKPGLALIGKAGTQFSLKKKGGEIEIILLPKDEKELFNPSADILMSEVANVYEGASIGVIMTGMGKDGSVGLKKMKEKGAYNIAESEETAVVFGMPKVAIEVGAVDKVLPLPKIPEELVRIFY